MDSKEIFKKISKVQKIFWVVGNHIFAFLMFLILLDLLFGLFLFYNYAILSENGKFQISQESAEFKINLYKKTLDQWQSRQDKLSEELKNNYSNPFSK